MEVTCPLICATVAAVMVADVAVGAARAGLSLKGGSNTGDSSSSNSNAALLVEGDAGNKWSRCLRQLCTVCDVVTCTA